ncbi:hypothetical protein GN157_16790 [Flavobacterium rakeshii]|uniref:Lipoprotein n=1 Tax=Flavobacterium rakeshii TaxID=1038845 RepID=A0A6N8HHY3_9FLAO|nr:hypothetical protein [Flavobacterium rakeshii]MUV05374.1 hypothetical protein [Flavobacterium rakeshii]
MKYLKLIILFCFTTLALSCNDDEKIREAEALRAKEQSEAILKVISENWKFNVPAVTPRVKTKLDGWNEWHSFKSELTDKPTGSLTAYRNKVKAIAEKADELNKNIPPFFDKPQVKSRIMVVVTKIRTLYTYINLDVVQKDKIVSAIGEISKETISLQNQLDELVKLSEIPKEKGEEDLLKALDTIRMANPDMIPDENDAKQKPLLKPKVLTPVSPIKRGLKAKSEN